MIRAEGGATRGGRGDGPLRVALAGGRPAAFARRRGSAGSAVSGAVGTAARVVVLRLVPNMTLFALTWWSGGATSSCRLFVLAHVTSGWLPYPGAGLFEPLLLSASSSASAFVRGRPELMGASRSPGAMAARPGPARGPYEEARDEFDANARGLPEHGVAPDDGDRALGDRAPEPARRSRAFRFGTRGGERARVPSARARTKNPARRRRQQRFPGGEDAPCAVTRSRRVADAARSAPPRVLPFPRRNLERGRRRFNQPPLDPSFFPSSSSSHPPSSSRVLELVASFTPVFVTRASPSPRPHPRPPPAGP